MALKISDLSEVAFAAVNNGARIFIYANTVQDASAVVLASNYFSAAFLSTEVPVTSQNPPPKANSGDLVFDQFNQTMMVLTFNDPERPTTVTTSKAWVAGINNAMAGAPPTQVTTIAQALGVIPAANFAGAADVALFQSGATALTTPTAATILAAIPFGSVGARYLLRIINTNAGLLTITPDASVTATGTMTLATQTWRDFEIVVVTATTATMKSIGTGTNS